MIHPRLLTLVSFPLLMLAAAAPAQEAGAPGDAVDLDGGMGPIPVIKSNALFKVSDGEGEWDKAYANATRPMDELGVEPQRLTEMMQEGFRQVSNFRAECYTRTKTTCETSAIIGAKEAWVDPDKPNQINMEGLRIVFFVSSSTLSLAESMQPKTGPKAGPKGPASLPSSLRQSRIVITAEEGIVDATTGEGHAAPRNKGAWRKGIASKDGGEKKDTVPKDTAKEPHTPGVRIEIFAMAADGMPTEPIAEMSCDGLRWRAWNDPRTGTSEMTFCATSDDPSGGEPEVNGRFVSRNPDTQDQSEMQIRARGMVFQTSILDHMQAVKDDEGTVLGVTNVVRRRMLFHREIGVRIDGSDSAPLIPFQQAPEPATGKSVVSKKPARPPAPPSRTLVGCTGPGILDLAVPPRSLPPGPADRIIPLAMRFEFLNGVEMHKFPLDTSAQAQATGTKTVLTCKHLCFQFPADAPTSLPEYAEATGGIRITGTRTVTDAASATPFRIDCQRVYFDAASDSTVLEGQPMYPVEIADEMGELSTQACIISRKTQMLYMPAAVKAKRALVRGARKKTPPTGAETGAPPAIDFSEGDLEATWFGSFRREVVPVLGPGNVETLKEVLLLDKDVTIQQTQKGLRIEGQAIRIVRNATTGEVERLEGRGDVLVRNNEMKVKGDAVTVELRYNEKNQIVQNTVIVWSPPDSGRKTVLWQGESAVSGDRFIIDALNNNFQAYGGVVSRFIMPESSGEKGAEAAGGAALIPGFSGGSKEGKPGSNRIALQCDGDFEFNGGTGQLRVTKNVLIAQGAMTIVSDGLILSLAPPTKEEPKKDEKKDKKDVPKKDEKKDDKKDAGLFSSSVQSFECRGRVEVTTPTQVVHCDRLFYDMASDQIFLETDRPDDKVRVYLQEGEGTKILEVTRRLDYNAKAGLFVPAERMILKPSPDTVPLPRTPPPTPEGAPI